jgi:hypothetical protein
MKNFKFILLLTSFAFVVSCNNSKKYSNEIVNLKIEDYLETAQNKFPNFDTNTAINDELNDYLEKDFKEALNSGILTDLPFKLAKVEKCGNKYVLKLEHSLTSKLYDRDVLSSLEIDLYALTDEKKAKSLEEGQFYVVNIKFKDYINLNNNEKYCASVLMSPFMGYFANQIQFGAIAVDLENIEKVSN